MRQAVNVRRLAAGLVVVGALCGMHPRAAEATSITVAANAPWGVATGIFASPGQQFVISASGIVDLASGDGGYVTNANGVLQADVCCGAAVHFGTYSISPNLTAGNVNMPTNIAVLSASAPWGALVGGFSNVAVPTSLSDFLGGTFSLIGASGTLNAPNAAGYQLFLATNDCCGFGDNDGAFFADVQVVETVPEPASLVLLGTGLVGLARARRRRRDVERRPDAL